MVCGGTHQSGKSLKNPKVTVLMSVYNGEYHLRDAVDSILNQSLKDFEFIIINDNSQDSTSQILKEFSDQETRITILDNHENIGLTRSLNKGLALANGEYIARQDADDISLQERLSVQAEYLDNNNDIALLGSAYFVIDSEGQSIAIHKQPLGYTKIRWQVLFHNAFCHTSVMFRRSLLQNGRCLYDESLRYSQDYDFWTRLIKVTRAVNLGTPLVKFRKTHTGISSTQIEDQQNIANSISLREIRLIVPLAELSNTQITLLRQWFYKFPECLSEDDLILCQQLLQILSAFEKQKNIDHAVVAELRQQLEGKILSSASVRQIKSLWTTGFLGAMLYKCILLIPKNIHKKMKSRLNRILFTNN